MQDAHSDAPDQEPEGFGERRGFIGASLLVWALLSAAAFAWIPQLRYAWAYNLWQYLPPWWGFISAGMGLVLCAPQVRRRIVDAAREIARWVGRAPARLRAPVAFVLLSAAFWFLRERQIFGDSYLLLSATRAGWVFIFPEFGATFLTWLTARLVEPLGIGLIRAAQLNSCFFGAGTILLLARAARHIVPAGSGLGPAAAALILSTGLLRIFAGHVEVYPAFLMFACLYLWAALVHIETGGREVGAALACGVLVWVHMAGLFVVPSLLLLPRLVEPSMPIRAWAVRAARLLVIASLPSFAFLGLAYAFGAEADIMRAFDKVLQTLGQSADPNATSWWVRFSRDEPVARLGIDYVFMSLAHLKYLANAYHLLAPGALLVIGLTLVARPWRLVGSAKARFLGVAALPMVAYSTLLRPFWGPFDWDLFAGAPFLIGALAAHLLATHLTRRDFEQVAVLVIGFQLLFVGAPFLAMAYDTPRRGGPFVSGSFYQEIEKRGDPPHGAIAPWL